MYKRILIITALVVVIGVLVFGAVNRTIAKNNNENTGQGEYGRGSHETFSTGQYDISYNQGQGNGSNGRSNSRGRALDGNGSGWLANLPPSTLGELSADESAALIYMREEEKLAHDVYVTLYDQWGLPIFQNISQSEQTHTDAVKSLIDRYGLTDPASSAMGVFTNTDLQSLYDDLVARGSQSLGEALKVGAAIEEIDILDLQSRLALTDNADIRQVFNNLMNGSYNHLYAYVSTLNTQTAETYQPQYLSVEAYQSIITSGARTGGNGRGGGQGEGIHGGRP